MALNDIAIASRALMRLGAAPISSFNDGTVESEIAGALYASVRDTVLSSYLWNFATAQIKLNELVDSPLADFQKAYALPNNFLRAISAGTGGKGRGLSFRIIEGQLHTNTINVTLTYIYQPEEELFPAYFTNALITRLAAEYAIPITESTTRADMLYRLAENELAKARQIDAQQDTPGRIEDFSLIKARES